MPLSLEAPVLQVDANVIHKVDTTNPANLFSMWTGEFDLAILIRRLGRRTDSYANSLCEVSRLRCPGEETREPELAVMES